MLEEGDLHEVIARSYIEPPNEGRLPSDTWSLTNRMIMVLHGYSAAAGFRQWEQMGRTVMKGERSFYILGPCTRTIEETIERETEEGREEQEVETKTILTGFRALPVFGFEQTEGDPLELPAYEPPVLPPLSEVGEAFGLSVRYEPKYGSSFGSYSPVRNAVVLHTHEPCTWWHELGHVAHFRVEQMKTTAGQDPYKELVAETVAGVQCCFYQKEQYIPKIKQYLKAYSDDQNVVRAVGRVLSTVEKCLNLIFDAHEELR